MASGRLLAADDLDQRQQVDRVERMADDQPLGCFFIATAYRSA
jgi:hypothetical protein